MPVAHRGFGAGIQARQVDAEVFQAYGLAQAPAVAAGDSGFVRLRIARGALLGEVLRVKRGRNEFGHGQFPARMLITAMRTAIPKVTCGRITECGPSATEESISTPRFIGPGCITIASGRATESLSSVRP